MIGSLLVVSLLTDTYTRSRIDGSATNSQCLWWSENTTIEFHQNADGNPETGSSVFTAFDKALASWQSQLATCASISLKDGATTTSRKAGYFSTGTNENITVYRQKKCTDVAQSTDACWKNDDCGNTYDCWQFSNQAIAITTTSYIPSVGQIIDADIELNQPSYIFSTVDSPACVAPVFNTNCVATDVQNTLTHELGHALGLAHNAAATSTMYASAQPGEISKRTLDQGSKQFVCDVYPAGKAARSCEIIAASNSLGSAWKGCSSAPLGLFGALGLVTLLLRRRRA